MTIFTPSVFLNLLYSVLHAILIMVQATTLNVAFNSHNKSLLTIMMSNNVSVVEFRHVIYTYNTCSCAVVTMMFWLPFSVCGDQRKCVQEV